ncbi:unnamed protein product [Effrenium voratum]|nr:unnamed protein product [Effrenium voratum]
MSFLVRWARASVGRASLSALAFREAGSSGDMAVGYFNIALHATFGGIFMPLAVWTAVRTSIIRLCWSACLGYAVLAVHSAAILMQAIGTQMHFFLDGGGLLFEGPNCIHSDVPSPLTLVLGILQSFAQAPRYQGPAGPSSCATVIGDPDAGHLERACAYRGVSCPEAKV